MARNNIHVVPRNGNWAVLREGGQVIGTASTQTKATEIARRVAIGEQAQVVVHRPDGRIRDANSYGNDPFPPRG